MSACRHHSFNSSFVAHRVIKILERIFRRFLIYLMMTKPEKFLCEIWNVLRRSWARLWVVSQPTLSIKLNMFETFFKSQMLNCWKWSNVLILMLMERLVLMNSTPSWPRRLSRKFVHGTYHLPLLHTFSGVSFHANIFSFSYNSRKTLFLLTCWLNEHAGM